MDKKSGNRPAWLLPVVLLGIIGGLIYAGKKNREVVENPIVDLVVLAIGVFAVAAVGRVVFTKAGYTGAATFFGAPAVASTS